MAVEGCPDRTPSLRFRRLHHHQTDSVKLSILHTLRKDEPMTPEQKAEFEALTRPLIKWLCENYHPHHTVIVTPTSAEMLEGVCCTGQVLDYVRD